MAVVGHLHNPSLMEHLDLALSGVDLISGEYNTAYRIRETEKSHPNCLWDAYYEVMYPVLRSLNGVLLFYVSGAICYISVSNI